MSKFFVECEKLFGKADNDTLFALAFALNKQF